MRWRPSFANEDFPVLSVEDGLGRRTINTSPPITYRPLHQARAAAAWHANLHDRRHLAACRMGMDRPGSSERLPKRQRGRLDEACSGGPQRARICSGFQSVRLPLRGRGPLDVIGEREWPPAGMHEKATRPRTLRKEA